MANRTSTLRTLQSTLLVFTFALLAVPVARGGCPVVWETGSRAELLNGESHGVSVTDAGALMLAPQFTKVFDTEQAYVWSSAADAAGNVYLGTGHDGKIFRVGADGKGSLLYDAAELDVTALVVGRDGALYAGTSPDGQVHRITPDGTADGSIYALALSDAATGPRQPSTAATSSSSNVTTTSAGGTVTGTVTTVDESGAQTASVSTPQQVRSRNELQNARSAVFRVTPDGGADVLWSSPTVTAFSVAAAPQGGSVLIGTSDKGRIYSVTDDRRH